MMKYHIKQINIDKTVVPTRIIKILLTIKLLHDARYKIHLNDIFQLFHKKHLTIEIN